MTILSAASGSLPLSLRKGETLVIRNLSGVETVTGSTADREDASYALGAGFVVYGPQSSPSSLTVSTSGQLDYSTVMGDPTPSRTQVVVSRDSATGEFSGLVDPLDGTDVIDAPSVIRGTVSASRWSGVVAGTVDTTQRNLNRTALQEAINYAGANRKFFELEPGLYEIDGGFLTVNSNNFNWRGTRDTKLLSYVTNQPILHIGPAWANSGSLNNVTIQGCALRYANAQTSSTRSNAMELTGVWNSEFSEFDIGDPYTVGSSPSDASIANVWNGVAFDNNSSASPCFSNVFRSFRVKSFAGAALYLLTKTSASATGNVWENTYISNGSTTGNRRVATDALRVEYSTQNVFDQLNIEWAQVQRMIFLSNAREQHFYGTNFERVTLYSPSAVRSGFLNLSSNSSICTGALHFYNCSVDLGVANGNSVANTIAKAGLYALGDNCSVDTQKLWYEGVTTSGGAELDILISESASGNSGPDVSIGSYWAGGTNNIIKAWNFTLSGSATRAINAPLVFGDNKNNRDTISNLSDADATLYVFRNSGVNICAPTAARTITLSSLNRSGGFTNPPGASFRFVVSAGAAGSIALRNLTAGGTLLKTLSAGQWAEVMFDGTNWNLIEFGSL